MPVCTLLEDDEGFKNVAISSPRNILRIGFGLHVTFLI